MDRVEELQHPSRRSRPSPGYKSAQSSRQSSVSDATLIGHEVSQEGSGTTAASQSWSESQSSAPRPNEEANEDEFAFVEGGPAWLRIREWNDQQRLRDLDNWVGEMIEAVSSPVNEVYTGTSYRTFDESSESIPAERTEMIGEEETAKREKEELRQEQGLLRSDLTLRYMDTQAANHVDRSLILNGGLVVASRDGHQHGLPHPRIDAGSVMSQTSLPWDNFLFDVYLTAESMRKCRRWRCRMRSEIFVLI